MTLKLYLHPLSSYCQKVLIALYETEISFEPVRVESPADWEGLRKLTPIGKFPLLRDETRDRLVSESTTIVEYLDLYCARARRMTPQDADRAFETRRLDRFFDLYVHAPMQEIVKHRLRAPGDVDRIAVEQAQKSIRTSYVMIEEEFAEKEWANGDEFSLADCAAAPALYYANKVVPISSASGAADYLRRLEARPSVARAFSEAEPYRRFFPATPSSVESGASA
jgi:glutathione S-transferase